MRYALFFVLLAGCSAQPVPTPRSRAPGGGDTAPPQNTDAASVERTLPEDAVGEGDAFDSLPSATFSLEERTRFWVVHGGMCVSMLFVPHDEKSGFVLFGGLSVNYKLDSDHLVLSAASYLQGDGSVARWCRTVFRLGPGNLVGGAPVFDCQVACHESLDSATPLDDSAATVARKCGDLPVVVEIEAVDCSFPRTQPVGSPGCIWVVLDSGFGRESNQPAQKSGTGDDR